jgi:hypothetical protein
MCLRQAVDLLVVGTVTSNVVLVYTSPAGKAHSWEPTDLEPPLGCTNRSWKGTLFSFATTAWPRALPKWSEPIAPRLDATAEEARARADRELALGIDYSRENVRAEDAGEIDSDTGASPAAIIELHDPPTRVPTVDHSGQYET